MPVYVGIDLHSSNHHIAIVNQAGKRVFHKKVVNDGKQTLSILKTHGQAGCDVAVESTYNWYWLVDLLMDQGYRLHLANPAAMQQYQGLKHADDRSDAFWLAEMLRLGILPQGYIYPREDRPVRDLLRKRSQMVKIRTGLILSLQNIVERNGGGRLNAARIKQDSTEQIVSYCQDQNELALATLANKRVIDSLSENIRDIEKALQNKLKPRLEMDCLQSMPGVGRILSMTILLESGDISRFANVGNYTSYCRKVKSVWLSNKKVKGRGNQKNGNRYLAWAFSEAAEMARRFNDSCRAFFDKKSARTNPWLARRALERKLTKVAYFIMKDQMPFDEHKMFHGAVG
jgi:transposase